MDRTIVTERATNLRFYGRSLLAGNWMKAVFAMVLVTVCLNVPTMFLDGFFGRSVELQRIVINGQEQVIRTGNVSPVSGIFMLLVSGALLLGLMKFFLALVRRQNSSAGQVFSGFEYFGKAFLLFLVYSLFIFLWTLLFIIPGIIASYRYSQAFYLLADDPKMGVMDCLRTSSAMMRDNKFKLFCVDLSFIGWLILAAIPGAIVQIPLQEALVSGGASYFISNLVMLAANAAMYWVSAYIMSTRTVFYEMVRGKRFIVDNELPEGEDAPSDDEQ